MKNSNVESPSKMEDGHVCAFCPHDVEDEVHSSPHVKDLKEENKRV